MSRKKLILTGVTLALILLIGGTIAYFTDTESATNTFTIGNVDITLTEPNWDESNGQNVTPGKTIAKDPTITNASTTNPAYVFAKIVVPTLSDGTPLFTFTAKTGWTLVGTATTDTTAKTITYVYAYGSESAMTSLATSASTPAVFDEVTFNSSLTSSNLNGVASSQSIEVTAYGIQTDLSVTAPTAVWALFSE